MEKRTDWPVWLKCADLLSGASLVLALVMRYLASAAKDWAMPLGLACCILFIVCQAYILVRLSKLNLIQKRWISLARGVDIALTAVGFLLPLLTQNAVWNSIASASITLALLLGIVISWNTSVPQE